MTGNLDEALDTLLKQALPDLLGGQTPPVVVSIASEIFEADPLAAEAEASEPRPDDRLDNFAFDPQNPPPLFQLTQPPYPGPRRVRLTTDAGDRIPLRNDEVVWDAVDSRIFSLALRPTHDLADVTGVQVLYGVTSVFTKVKLNQTFSLQLQSNNAAQLEEAEALALGIIELNRQTLLDAATVTYEEGDYGATVSIKSFKLVEGTSPAADQRHLTYHAEVELKATRALTEDEGAPIVRIRTPGRPVDPNRPIDIHIDVDS